MNTLSFKNVIFTIFFFAYLSAQFLVSSWADALKLADAYKNPQDVNITAGDGVFLIATWCPYSRIFVNSLLDDRVKPYLENKKIVFIIPPEWTKYSPNDSKSKYRKTQEEIKQIQEQVPEFVFRPDVLNSLKWPYYFFNFLDPNVQDANIQLLTTMRGYPSAYSFAERGFLLNPDKWLSLNTILPTPLWDKIYSEYEQAEISRLSAK
jgi:hypothetical protein